MRCRAVPRAFQGEGHRTGVAGPERAAEGLEEFRGEPTGYCYRMPGSFTEAEDADA